MEREWRGNGRGAPNPDTLEAQALWSGPSSALPEVYPASHILNSYWPSAGHPSSCDDAAPALHMMSIALATSAQSPPLFFFN